MTAAERSAEIAVPAEGRYVAIARNFVVEMARSASWPQDQQVEDLRLMVSEAVTNAIRAQLGRGGDDHIRVRCTTGPDEVEVRVVDRAGGFDLPVGVIDVPEPDPHRVGGFGLPLMGALADEAHIEPSDDGTEVRLVIRRDGAGPG